jgi:hypothetical protein
VLIPIKDQRSIDTNDKETGTRDQIKSIGMVGVGNVPYASSLEFRSPLGFIDLLEDIFEPIKKKKIHQINKLF